MTAYANLFAVGCVDADHCAIGGNGDKVAVTSNGGASWSEVSLPNTGAQLASVSSVTCLPDGTCYAIADMTKYSNTLIFRLQ